MLKRLLHINAKEHWTSGDLSKYGTPLSVRKPCWFTPLIFKLGWNLVKTEVMAPIGDWKNVRRRRQVHVYKKHETYL